MATFKQGLGWALVFGCGGQAALTGCGHPGADDEVLGRQSEALSKPAGVNGDASYCNNPAALCVQGEGDCDSNAQCVSPLSCVADIGPRFGMGEGYDVCAPATCRNHVLDGDEQGVDCGGSCGVCGAACPGTPGGTTFCAGCSCASGQGDCDFDDECAAGLVCGTNNGPRFGMGDGYDACWPQHCENHVQDAAELGVDCGDGCGPCAQVPASPATLCDNGSCLPVRYLSSSMQVAAAATDLAATLSRMSGTTVAQQLRTTFEPAGIWLLTAAEATAAQLGSLADLTALSQDAAIKREHFAVRSYAGGLVVVGSTTNALRNGAWYVLHRLGYRQYFPGALWERVPVSSHIETGAWAFALRPPFRMRRIWLGFGTWGDNAEEWTDWAAKNGGGYADYVAAGHAYDSIIASRNADFAQHPEWRPNSNGQPTNKLCTTSAGLVESALVYYAGKLAQGATSVSAEPSDGGGWLSCADANENAMPISDRAVYFANEVASGLQNQYPGTLVGMYAYNQHAAPPTIAVSPFVAAFVATAFNNTGLSFDETVSGWRAKGAQTGVRDYFSVNMWDRDRPGAAAAGRPSALVDLIQHYQELGLEHLSAESSDAAGPLGVGHYLAARQLLGVATDDSAETASDVVTALFPSATAPMQAFYQHMTGEGGSKPLLSSHLIHQLYASLQDALTASTSTTESARVRALALYVRYVELWMAYSSEGGNARQARFETLIRFAYRIHRTHMVHSLALYRDLDRRDGTVSIPAGAEWNTPEPQNPWKSSVPYTDTEIDAMISQGLANNALAPFEPKAFSSELVPAAPPVPAGLTNAPRGTVAYYRGRVAFKTYRPSPGPFGFTMRTSVVAQGSTPAVTATNRNNALPIAVNLYESNGASEDPVSTTSVDSTWSVVTDGAGNQTLQVTNETACLCAHQAGMHDVIIPDKQRVGFGMTTPVGDRWAFEVGPDSSDSQQNRWSMYMYVPKGTTRVGVYTEGAGSTDMVLYTAANQRACLVDWSGTTDPCALSHKPAGYYAFGVPAGQDGQVWRIYNAANTKTLFTTPFQVSFAYGEMLLPKDVVEADGIAANQVTVSASPPECANACN